MHGGRSDTLDEFTKKLTRDPDLFLLAECMGEVIGAVIGGYAGRQALVYHPAALEEYRRPGIGRALMETMEDLLREKGCLRSCLLITKDNPAIEFYEEQGWQMLDLYALGKDIQ